MTLMTHSARAGFLVAVVALGLGSMAAGASGQGSTVAGASEQGNTPARVDIPKKATAIEGLPSVRVDTTETGTVRRQLNPTEAAEHRLQIRVKNGRLFWASQGNVPLTLDASGSYTYLSSTPGRYVRLTKVRDRISYVEHLDMAAGNVTFWGEVRIELGR